MDFDMLQDKLELIIKGMKAQNDIEAFDEFCDLLDYFILRQIKRCEIASNNQESMSN